MPGGRQHGPELERETWAPFLTSARARTYGKWRMKILFLGENRSRLSVDCLESLLNAGCGEVTVGIGGLTFRAWRRRVARGLRRHGLRGELASGARWAKSLLGALWARLGCGEKQERSLRSVLAEHPAARCFEFQDINAPENVARLRALAPDVILVAALTQILKPVVISVPPLGCINVHPALLPRYRGVAPSYWMLKNRERFAGVTIHYIDEGIDTGDIITQETFEIEDHDDERSLVARSAAMAARLMVETVRRLAAGESLPRRPQDHSQATYST